MNSATARRVGLRVRLYFRVGDQWHGAGDERPEHPAASRQHEHHGHGELSAGVVSKNTNEPSKTLSTKGRVLAQDAWQG